MSLFSYMVNMKKCQAVFLNCCPVCLRFPANAIQIDQATWAISAAIKKYHHTVHEQVYAHIDVDPYLKVVIVSSKFQSAGPMFATITVLALPPNESESRETTVLIWSVWVSLCCLMTPGPSKDIRCHVWQYLFLALQITRADIRPQ